MLPTPFSFIWVLKMLIGYSTFLINIYLGIFVNFKNLVLCLLYKTAEVYIVLSLLEYHCL